MCRQYQQCPQITLGAHGHAVAFLELLPVILDQILVGGVDFHHRAHVFVAMHGGIDDFLFGLGASVQDFLALVSVFVGAADA